MAKYIGRLINVGFGKEATRGQAGLVTQWMPKTNIDFQEKTEVIQDESSIGVIADNVGGEVVKRWAEGNIEGNIGVESIGLLLLAIFGNSSSAVASAGAYQHDFTVANTNQHQSLTIATSDPIGDTAFSNGMVESVTINGDVGGFATISINFKSKPGFISPYTAVYTTDYNLLVKSGIFKVASDLAGLPGATAKCIKTFELTITKNLEEDFCIGEINVQDFLNTSISVEGSFTAIYENKTDYETNALGGVDQALRISLIDTNTTIGASDNPTLEFDIAKCSFTEFSKSQSNDEIVTQTITYKGAYSITDSSLISGKLINTTNSY